MSYALYTVLTDKGIRTISINSSNPEINGLDLVQTLNYYLERDHGGVKLISINPEVGHYGEQIVITKDADGRTVLGPVNYENDITFSSLYLPGLIHKSTKK